MATISSKKLLPSAEGKKQVFLVPLANVVPSTPKLEGITPVEKKAGSKTTVIGEKITEVTRLFRYGLLLKERDRRRKIRLDERKRREQRETKLEEKKLGKKGEQEKLAKKIPGSSIFDRLQKFLGFTLFGFIFNNYGKYLPRLLVLGKVIKPAVEGFLNFSETILSATVTFINEGYKAYDAVGQWVEDIGGENAKALFDKFSKELNVYLNTAILIGLTGMRGGAFTPRRGPQKPKPKPPGRPPGTSAGAGFASGFTAGFALCELKGKVPGRKINEAARSLQNAAEKGVPASQIAKNAERLAQEALQEVGSDVRVPVASGSRPGVATPPPGGFGSGAAASKDFLEEMISKSDDLESITRNLMSRGVPENKARRQALEMIERSRFNTPRPNIDSVGDFLDAFQKGQINSTSAPDIIKGLISRDKISVADAEVLRANTYGGGGPAALKDMRAEMQRPRGGYDELDRAVRGGSGETLLDDLLGSPPTTPKPTIPQPTPTGGRFSRFKGFFRAGAAPFIGGVIDFVLNIASGEKPAKAGVRALGSTIGGWAGGALGTVITGLAAFPTGGLGLFLAPIIVGSLGVGGAILGDILFGMIYDGLAGALGGTRGYSQGGIIESRQIKLEESPKKKKNIVQPSPIGFKAEEKYRDYYNKGNQNKPYSLLRDAHGELSGMGGFFGSLLAGTVALLNGQFFEPVLLSYVGSAFGRTTKAELESTGRIVANMVRNPVGIATTTTTTTTTTTPPQTPPRRRRNPPSNYLPPNGTNGRMRPNQLTKVGTLSGSPTGGPYWYGNGAYLEHTAAKYFIKAKEAARKEGITITINSAYRSYEHQQALVGLYPVVAAPGTSAHGLGIALDIEVNAGWTWLKDNGSKYGWEWSQIPNDDVHFEFMGAPQLISKTRSATNLNNIASAKTLSTNTSYEVESNNILMRQTFIQPVVG